MGTPYPRSVGFDTDTLELGDEEADVVDGGGLRPKGGVGVRSSRLSRLGGRHGREVVAGGAGAGAGGARVGGGRKREDA